MEKKRVRERDGRKEGEREREGEKRGLITLLKLPLQTPPVDGPRQTRQHSFPEQCRHEGRAWKDRVVTHALCGDCLCSCVSLCVPLCPSVSFFLPSSSCITVYISVFILFLLLLWVTVILFVV